jgi:RHS repeat-associated protein
VKDKDRVGLTFHFKYDTKNRCIESWGDYDGKPDLSLADDVPKVLADGKTRAKGIHHCKFDYGQGKYTEVADSTRVDRFFGNPRGTLDKSIEGGAVMTAAYDANGFQTARSNDAGATTRWVRDDRGRILRMEDPLGRVWITTRDSYGLPLTLRDPDGNAAEADRDQRGNVALTRDPMGGVTQYAYDDRGLVTRIVTPNGATTLAAYDAQGNLVELVQPNGGAWRWTYDALGRRVADIDPVGATTRYTHSPRGDLLEVVAPTGDVTTYSYDGEQQVTRVLNAQGASTTFAYGGFRRTVGCRKPTGGEVAFRYNREGELVQIVNERGDVYRIEYSPAGRIVAEHTFEGRTTRFRYDGLARLARIERPSGEKIEYEYDLADQPVARKGEGFEETFEYNGCGELVRSANAEGHFTFERDARGRIVRESQTVDGVTHVVERRLDPMGDYVLRRSSLGYEERVSRDVMRSPVRSELGQEIVAREFDLLGRESRRYLAGGATLERDLDPMGRMVEARLTTHLDPRAPAHAPPLLGGPPPPRARVAYRYDAAGELASEHDAAKGSTSYTYDGAGRLRDVVHDGTLEEHFRYDETDNITESVDGAWEYSGNVLVKRGAVAYEWDAEGRLARRRGPGGEWTYEWAGDRMAAARASDGRELDFVYDPGTRRMLKRLWQRQPDGKRVLVQKTRYVWDGDVVLHEVRETVAPPRIEERTYLYDEDSFIPRAHRERRMDAEREYAPTWLHYMTDPIGAPTRLVDSLGNMKADLSWRAFGSASPGEPADVSTPIRSQGQLFDDETGLSYNRFRYYEADSGRFVSPDPIGLAGSLNTYAFGINPKSWIDALGLDWNYRLRDTSGNVYYHGRASDNDTPAGVMGRHAGTTGSDGARFGKGDQLEQVTPKGTAKDITRGVEQGGIVDGGTKTGTRSCNGTPGKARGNKIAGSSNPKKAATHQTAANTFLQGQGLTSATQLPTIGSPHTRP